MHKKARPSDAPFFVLLILCLLRPADRAVLYGNLGKLLAHKALPLVRKVQAVLAEHVPQVALARQTARAKIR